MGVWVFFFNLKGVELNRYAVALRSHCIFVAQRLPETRRRLQDLEKLQARMEHAAALWENMPDGMPDGEAVCQLIEAIVMED